MVGCFQKIAVSHPAQQLFLLFPRQIPRKKPLSPLRFQKKGQRSSVGIFPVILPVRMEDRQFTSPQTDPVPLFPVNNRCPCRPGRLYQLSLHLPSPHPGGQQECFHPQSRFSFRRRLQNFQKPAVMIQIRMRKDPQIHFPDTPVFQIRKDPVFSRLIF